MKEVKYLIIGAGLSGISFANSIKDDFLIIEKESVIGGGCKSYKQNEFVWDQGGHFFHTKNYDNFKYLLDRDNVKKIEKKAKIYIDSTYIDYPFQNNIKQLSDKEYNKCLNGLKKKKFYKNNNLLCDLYSKYGKAIVKKFLKPYNEKLYCTNLKKLSKTAMGRFFPEFSLSELEKPIQYNQHFYYCADGIQSLLAPIFEKIDKNKIIFDCHYVSIDTSKKIVNTNKGSFKYTYLINTSPFDEFYKIVENKEYLRDRRFLKCNKVLVFNMGFNQPSKHLYHWVYYPENKFVFYRVGFYNNIIESPKLSVYVEVALENKKHINVKKIRHRILKDLRKAGVIDLDYEIISSNYVIISPAYININEKSNEIVERKIKEWQDKGIFTLGRYGKWEYSCMEDSIVGAENLANDLRG